MMLAAPVGVSTQEPPNMRTAAGTRRQARVLGAMALVIAATTALAMWDLTREADTVLRDFAREQVSLAHMAAEALASQASVLGSVGAGAELAHLLPEGGDFGGASVVALLLPPRGEQLLTRNGGRARCDSLTAAIRRGASWVRLDRDEAHALGLPRRTAIGGIARVDLKALGGWGLAIVASAAHERDRATHAQWRSMLSILLAVLVVAAFGSSALRTQRARFELERALASAQLQEQQSLQLERENRAATMLTLAAGVAHEVSTPLSVIAGRAEQLLRADEPHAQVQRLARVIHDQCQRIREVIRGFLQLARGHEPVLDSVRPYHVLRTASELVEHRFSRAGVALSVESPEHLPRVSGDALLLQQALANLLLNACDACAHGGKVSAYARHERGRVLFTVDDDGMGINEADAARVLEPFFSTKPDTQGVGIGLAVTKEIVSIHRGTLRLEPRAPRGTRATICVPVAAELSHAS